MLTYPKSKRAFGVCQCIWVRATWFWCLENFTPPSNFPQSDLGRRADSRWALPQISSCFCWVNDLTLIRTQTSWLIFHPLAYITNKIQKLASAMWTNFVTRKTEWRQETTCWCHCTWLMYTDQVLSATHTQTHTEFITTECALLQTVHSSA